MKTFHYSLLLIILITLAVPVQAIDVEINDSEFLILNISTSSPSSGILDALDSPVQSNPSSLSYLIDTEYSVTDVTAITPTSAVLDALGSPVQPNPSTLSYLIDTEYSVTDVTAATPTSAVLNALVSPIKSNPSSLSYLIDTEFTILDNSNLESWYMLDGSLPFIIVDSPPGGKVVTTPTIVIEGSASSETSSIASVTVSGMPAIGTTDWNAEVSLIEGENIITIIAKDLQNNKRISKLIVYYYALEDIRPLFSYPTEIELGGTYYKWYKTIPYSTIYIDSNYLEYSQPDELGIFYISINTSELGITAPGTLDIITNSVSITKNGQTTQADTSTLNFILSILPRNYSTSWYLGSTLGGGGGIIAYAEGERNVDFTMTTGNSNSILQMVRDKREKETVGATAGFEAKAPVIGEIKVLSGDIHASGQQMYGSQVSVDYENGNDIQKLEGALYILTSTISTANPLKFETINAVSNILATDLTTDYHESGVAFSGASSLNLFKIKFGPKSVTETGSTSATLGSVDVGLGVEAGKSIKTRSYPVTDYEEYLIQYVYSADAGLSGSVLGNDVVDWGPSQYLDSTVILGQDSNNVLYGKLRIKDNEKPVILDYVTRELTYDYGVIADESIINPFEIDDVPTSSIYDNFIENRKNFARANTTVYETRGKKLELELPLNIKVFGLKLSLDPGIRMGAANNYLTDKNVIINQREYDLEKYAYDEQVQGSAEELNYIIESLFAPVGNIMETVMDTMTDMAEKGKEIIFTTGTIIFDMDTNFVTYDQIDSSSSMATGTMGEASTQAAQTNQTPEISIYTFRSNEPTSQTMSVFSTMGISPSYVSSISGADFLIGNITDLQPYNLSFAPAAKLTLNYTGIDIIGINESNISIYRWADSNNSWMPLLTIVDMAGNNASTNITLFGTYAIGYDITVPIIEWNSSNIYQDNVTVEAFITDSGSGINTSSIQLYLDEQEQTFTYNIFSGLLKSSINTSANNHTVRIYAEDTSGNCNFFEKDVVSIKPVAVSNISINCTDNDTLELSWAGENGSYQIQYYQVYRDVELIASITQTNLSINNTNSATFRVYPVDVNNNAGIGNSITYQQDLLIPQFTYNWKDTLYPITGSNITFNATMSHIISGTFGTNITNYTWIFENDTRIGEVVNYSYNDAGLHKVTLLIGDENQKNATLTKVFNVENFAVSGDLNNNGYVDIGDVAKVAFMVAGKVPEELSADFNDNGYVDIGDAAKIAFYLAGKVGEL